jgi:hypothetical protein
MVMKSSGFVGPLAVAIVSTALLSGTAASQTATGSASQLPSITVQAPNQVARPQRPQAGAAGANTVVARPTSPAPQTPPTSPEKRAPDSVMARIAALEKNSSNCIDGCQTSFKSGNSPWIGCNASGGVYSTTCRNVRNFKTYAECVENGLLLGYKFGEQWAYCSSLHAGGKLSGEKLQVAELKRPVRR